jgi:NDP-sugar pyrophosphorylase family protein
LDIDYAAAFRAFDCSGAEALMTVLNNEDKWGKSNVCFRAGVIESYDKNASGPHIRHIDYGLSFIRRDAVASMPDGEKFDLAELFQKLIEKKQLAGHEVSNRFYEINTPESLIETEEYLWSTINGVDKS